MASLQRVRLLPNQRLDLPDFNRISEFVCADSQAVQKYQFTDENFVIRGFEATGVGSTDLTITVANSMAVLGENSGQWYVGAPSIGDIVQSNLTPNATNFVEFFVDTDTGGTDSRAFWDQTANAGEGGEFSQQVDTFAFLRGNLSINTAAFTGESDKLPICEVDVNGSGVITAVRDARNLMHRLGRRNDSLFAFPWVTRTEPATTDFNGADKDIQNMKEWMDAVMDSVRELKGTVYWYEQAPVSLNSLFRNVGLSNLSSNTETARFTWDGTQLLITDNNGSPTDSDILANIVLFDSPVDINLTRQDGVNALSLADGEVLWVELPNPLATVSYDSVGFTSLNYRVNTVGSVPLVDSTFWLAYRRGTKLYLRGLGELEAGESRQINDETTAALQQFLGFDPETATSVPYSATPDTNIFANVFSINDPLAEAISTNAFNINALGGALEGNVYDEALFIVDSLSGGVNEIVGPVPANTILTLPLDTRAPGAPASELYVVGRGILQLVLNGQTLIEGEHWQSVGLPDTTSDQIEILTQLEVDDVIVFRQGTLGGFNAGAGGGAGDGQNVGTGTGDIFKQVVGSTLEFRRILAGPGITITTVGDDVVISTTGGLPTPAFVNQVTGQSSNTVPTGTNYAPSTNRLEAYRNGVLMANTTTLGNAADRYTEDSETAVELAEIADPTEVFTFVHNTNVPNYRMEQIGVSGNIITVPTYVPGNNSLRVFRNGVLMNAIGAGDPSEIYTESSNTTINLTDPANSNDLFVIMYEDEPQYRVDLSGLSGNTIAIPTYVTGSNDIVVYRNGVLMYDSTTLGNAIDRYQEGTDTTITLEVAASPTEVFTVIRK